MVIFQQNIPCRLAIAAWFLFKCSSISIAVAPAKIFSDHMVLQRAAAVPLWGKAAAGASVTVAFAGQSVEAKADKEGRWKVKLDPMKSSAKGRSLPLHGPQRLIRGDIIPGLLEALHELHDLRGDLALLSGAALLRLELQRVVRLGAEQDL